MKHLILFTFTLFSLSAFSQTQIGSDIDGEAAGDNSGESVSLSSDGKRVAIGAPNNSGNGINSGHVRIYEAVNGVWTQIGNDIDGEASYDRSGRYLSISSDGKRVAIGAIYNDENGSNSGHVRIYEENNGTWTQIGSDIDGDAAIDNLGIISLSSDGKRVAIGAPGKDANGNDSGQVRIYGESNGIWTQVGSDIDGDAAGDFLGCSLTLSSDGNVVAIGVPNSRILNYFSRIKIYVELNGTWTQVGSDIVGEDLLDGSGKSVSLSSDGKRVAIGAYRNNGNGTQSGHVRIYDESSGTWTQVGSDIDGEAAQDESGNSVSLSADGKRVAIGAPGNDSNGSSSGHVRIYDEINGTWTQVGSDIDGEATGDASGHSVSLSLDGKSVAIGAWGNDDNGTESGHVRIFALSNPPTSNINLENMLNTFSIFPNPNAGQFQLEVTGKPIDQLNLQVMNALGVKVFERSINFTSGQITTDIDLEVPSGNYMLMVQHGQHKAYRKLSIVE